MLKNVVKGLSVLLLGMVLTGCSSSKNDKSSASSSNVSAKKSEATYYQDLSRVEQKKVKFSFKVDQDETQDNSKGSMFLVSMKVKNNSNQNIKFNKSKFVLLSDNKKVVSNKKGILKLKVGQKVELNELFTGVPEELLNGGGNIIYLNQNNKIASNNFKKQLDKFQSEENSSTEIQPQNSSSNVSSSQESSEVKQSQKSGQGQASSAQSNNFNEADFSLSLTDFINKYGMSPAAYRMEKMGMSEEEALKVTPDDKESSGELQNEHSPQQFTDEDGDTYTKYPDGSIEYNDEDE